ncbi:calcium-binding protein [Pseudomonas helmanticensis]|uniref:calcium-binding protein n=1 Tax=Pseudomonas helmanticensis TaxID=1471381 RepID=UPI0024B64465|nr:calcium-binding protein [Pseudomonas helmanticensis]
MSYIFNDLEKTEIFKAANACGGMNFRAEHMRYEAEKMEGGSCTRLYQALSDIIGSKFRGGAEFEEEVVDIIRSAKLWLDVAIDANGGRGAYSALIRAYTLRQGELRLNKVFSEIQMQESSNQVAVNFMNSLMNGSVKFDLPPWTVPSIDQVAAIDASAIGEVLFSKEIGIEDSASSQNAGWSGTIGFSLLGGKPPYETWRLISAGDPGSDIKGSHELAKVNRLDDYKNILFAMDSYSAGLRSVIKNFGVNMVGTLFSVLPEQINIGLASGNINPLIQYVVKNTPVSPIVNLILRYGLNDFFDMFRRTYDGNSAAMPTTNETFATNAYAFFSALLPTQSQSIVTRTIGEYGSATAWATLAAEATPVGEALRNSLKQLSEVVIERADGYSGRGLELYDPQTGEGVITEQWIADRAQMLARLISRTNGSYGENTLRKFSYSDLASGKQAPMSTGVSNPLVMFGDDGGRSFAGGANADHLYGGAGNDSINGLTGNDFVEGGRGRDSLTGGEGNDALYGMADDDVLVGGRGNDFLIGGEGNDRYEFSTGDGIDEIFEAGIAGQIVINGLPIPALKRSTPLSNTWFTDDRAIAVTLIEELNESTLNIKYGPGDLIVIKNFQPGMFGIRLPDYQGQTVSSPDLILQGDWKAKDTDPATPGEQVSYDELGNVLVLPKVKQRNKADVLYGSAKDDVILGLGGSDRLFGKAGDDRLFGDKQTTLEKALADGSAKGKASRGDWLDGGEGDDLLIGTASRDVLLGGNNRDTLVGGAGDDVLYGDNSTGMVEQNWSFKQVERLVGSISYHTTVFSKASPNATSEGDNDVLYGQGGRDVLNGGWGEDLLDGGTEDDLLWGEGGNDTLLGGHGNDTLSGDDLDSSVGLQSKHHGDDLLDGGMGDDRLAGNGGNDVLYGGPGNDDLKGDDVGLDGVAGNAAIFFGRDLLDGGAGDDTLCGGGADDSLLGGTGKDDLTGDYPNHPVRYHGDDFLDGGEGDDTLRGAGGSDTLIGGSGADALDGDAAELQSGGVNNDYLQGDAGNDTLLGGLGADTLYGGADDDVLVGDYEQKAEADHGPDYMDGGSGNDTLQGGGGNDTLIGGEGMDYLRGDSGNNVLEGGTGNDLLESEDGDDIYCFGIGDGLDVINDPGGKNVIRFGAGFSAENLQVDIIEINAGRVLRLSNGKGDAVLLRRHENWQGSTFSFSDGVTLSYQDVMKKIQRPIEVVDPPVTNPVMIEEHKDITEVSSTGDFQAPSDGNVLDENAGSASGNGADWTSQFLAELKEKRSTSRRAKGFILNEKGIWVRNQIVTNDTGFTTHTDLLIESVENGALSATPQWMGSAADDAVISERQSESTSQVEYKNVKAEGAISSSVQKPYYYRSGTGSGFSFKTGDVIVEDRKDSGAIEGWFIYPAGSFGVGETVRKEFRWNVTTETIKHKIVQGSDAGGRVNVEVGNLFLGGAGDDVIVAYAGSPLDYGAVGGRTLGALLSAGAGNDTLLGSEGADYLIAGAGEDWLYGEDGADTYIVQSHAGATTVIADVLNPVFLRPEVGVTGWSDEYGVLDQDTVILPDEAMRDQLQLSWGAALIEAVNVELAPDPHRDAYRRPLRAKMLYSTLDIRWGGSQQVRIVLPHAGDLAGSGIEIIKFADGTSVSLKQLLESSQLSAVPDTYHQGVIVNSSTHFKSIREGQALPLVGGHGNDTLSGSGEIRGLRGDDLLTGNVGDDILMGGAGNDTLSGGAGNDLYRYDGLGRDVVMNAGGGTDGVDFSTSGLSIDNLKFHRENDDLVVVVDYGMSPKIRVSNHFSGGDAAISFIRVNEAGKSVRDYSANELSGLLHPLPPLRDVEDILTRNDEEALQALAEIVKFYDLNV